VHHRRQGSFRLAVRALAGVGVLPPRPEESDYWGAVGDDLPDTLARMANVLQRIRPGTGSEFGRCWAATHDVQ
jgi:hypothetical protein